MLEGPPMKKPEIAEITALVQKKQGDGCSTERLQNTDSTMHSSGKGLVLGTVLTDWLRVEAYLPGWRAQSWHTAHTHSTHTEIANKLIFTQQQKQGN